MLLQGVFFLLLSSLSHLSSYTMLILLCSFPTDPSLLSLCPCFHTWQIVFNYLTNICYSLLLTDRITVSSAKRIIVNFHCVSSTYLHPSIINSPFYFSYNIKNWRATYVFWIFHLLLSHNTFIGISIKSFHSIKWLSTHSIYMQHNPQCFSVMYLPQVHECSIHLPLLTFTLNILILKISSTQPLPVLNPPWSSLLLFFVISCTLSIKILPYTSPGIFNKIISL